MFGSALGFFTLRRFWQQQICLLIIAIASSPAPIFAAVTSDELVDALGMQEYLSAPDGHSLSLVSDTTVVLDSVASAAIRDIPGSGQAVELSTGEAGLEDLGNTDFEDDDEPDCTQFSLMLAIPDGKSHAVYSTGFATGETDPVYDDYAEMRYSLDGAPQSTVSLGRAQSEAANCGDGCVKTRSTIDLAGAETLDVEFEICDAGSGDTDSVLIILELAFSSGEFVSADDLAEALLGPDSGIEVESVSLTMTSNGTPVQGIDSVKALPAYHGVYLFTGMAEDGGLGNTDFLQDGLPDCVEFELELAIPHEDPTEIKSLLFTTQFSTSEPLNASGANDHAQLEYWMDDPPPATNVISLGSKVQSAEPVSRPVLRALNVIDSYTVTLQFKMCDAGNGSVDSALFISRLFFSDTIDATAVTKARPDRSKPKTGSYTYSKQLLHVPGRSPFLPFDFTIYYSSIPTRNSTTLDCYMLFGLFPMACIPYYDFYRDWTNTYNWAVTAGEVNQVIVKRGDGVWEYFTKSGAEWIPEFEGNFSRLTCSGASCTYTTVDNIRYTLVGGKLTLIEDDYGNRIAIQHLSSGLRITDTRDKVATITPDGRDWVVTYDGIATVRLHIHLDSEGSANLASVTDPVGQTTTYTYKSGDVQHNLLETITDPDGNRIIKLQYDGDFRVVKEWDANDSVTTTQYVSNFVTRTDREGRQSFKIFDLDDRLIVEQDPAGGIVNYSYDEHHNITEIVDPLGYITSQIYDGWRLQQRVNAHGDGTISTYDECPNKTSKTVSDGVVSYSSSFDYDECDRNLRTVTDPSGHQLSYTYNDDGQVTSSTDRNGNVYEFSYNDEGELESTTDPTGVTTSFEYDGLGRMTETSGPGVYTTRVFDLAGRLQSETDALDRVTSYSYDSHGRVLTETAPDGAVTTFEYRRTGEVSKVIDPLGIEMRYEYNKEGQQTRTIDPLDRSVTYLYDDGGRLVGVNVEDKDGEVINSTDAVYDLAGNNTGITDPLGHVTEFEHDRMKRVTAETDGLGNRVESEYADPRGLLTRFTNARGQRINHSYDDSGRLEALHFVDSAVSLTHVLDPNGNRLSSTLESEGSQARVTGRVFDPLNRITERTDEFGNTISYVYDAAGNLEALTYSDGKTVHYEYDALNRLIAVTDWAGRETRYAYDEAGNLREAVAPDGSTVTYTYDLSGRLTGIEDLAEDGTVIYQSTMVYNEAGLRVSESVAAPLESSVGPDDRQFEFNEANQLTSDGASSYEYDADGNLTEGVIGGTAKSFVYDQLNRLVGAGRDAFRYDADGFRVETTIDRHTTRNVYAPEGPFPRLLEQQDDRGRIIARYVYGVGLVGREIATRKTLEVYHFDSRGSTVGLTDESGRLAAAYAYGPYGMVVASEGPASVAPSLAKGLPRNPFTFLGRWGTIDDGNGLYLAGARYFAPELMRFIQKDPAFAGRFSDPQSLNRYTYVLGNPIQLIDPSGTYFGLDDAFLSLIGAVANMVSTLVSDLISGEWSSYMDYMAAFIGGAVAGATAEYLGPVGSALLSSAVAEGWKGLTKMMAAPYQFALTMTTPDWKSYGIDSAVAIGVGTAMGVASWGFGKVFGGKSAGTSATKSIKSASSKKITQQFGKNAAAVATAKQKTSPGRKFFEEMALASATGFSHGFFIRGDRWGLRDRIPIIAILAVSEDQEPQWDPLSP